MDSLCVRCNGNGTYRGNGFMMTDCELCKEKENRAPELDDINRQSSSYKDAIKDIMLTNKITRKEAVKMFDEAYVKD